MARVIEHYLCSVCYNSAVNIHFENWSEPMFLGTLERAGKPHGGRIIKVFANEADPRELSGKDSLVVVETSGEQITPSEVYSYPGNRTYSGATIEEELARYGFDAATERKARALFRFSNQYGFCQAALSARWADGTGISHPLEDIDGIPPKNGRIQ